MSLVPIDEVVYFDVTLHHPVTGAVSDGDSAPTFDVFEEATDTPILDDQTMTKRTSLTGNYRGTFTASAANGFEAGKWYNVIVTAIVNSVTAKHRAMLFRVAPAESSAGVPKGDVSHFGGSAGTFASGIPETKVASIAADAITASAIADNAIDAGAIASDAITAAKINDGAFTAAKFASGAFDAVWSVATRLLTAGTNIVLAKGTGVTGFNDLSAAQVNAEADTALADYDAPTKAELDAAVAPLATAAALATVDGIVDDILVDTAEIGAAGAGLTALASQASVNTIDDFLDTEIAAIKAKTDNLPSDPADASDIAASFASLASTLTTIAGYIDTEVAAIKAKTDLIPASPAAVGDIPTATQNADALLKRDLSAVTGEATRSVLNAVRFLRNRWAIAGGTLTVYKEDDSSSAWTAAATQTAGNPVSEIDPA